MRSNISTNISPTTWLIREDIIRPGDILLTKGQALISDAISFLSDGKFSHAAVFVSPSSVFESYDLVDFAWLKSVGYTIENGNHIRWSVLPHEPVEAELWRHREIGNISEDRFQTVYFEMMENFWGMEYSLYSRLVPLAQMPVALRRLGVVAVELYDKYIEKSKIPGPFCSELVTEFYLRLPLQIFNNERKPSEVSPNDFLNSKLTKISSAILRREEIRDFILMDNEDQEATAKIIESFNSFAGLMRDQRIAMKSFDGLDELTRQIQAQSDQWVSKMVDTQREQISKLIHKAKLIPKPMLYQWVSQLVAEFKLVSAALLAERKSKPANANEHKLWLDAFDKVCVSTLRLSAITNSRCLKLIEAALIKSKPWFWWIRRLEILRGRRKILMGAREFITFKTKNTKRERVTH